MKPLQSVCLKVKFQGIRLSLEIFFKSVFTFNFTADAFTLLDLLILA